MSPLELVDDRFDKLAEELRASRPTAPAALRTQVRALEPPAPRWTFPTGTRSTSVAPPCFLPVAYCTDAT